MDPLIKELQGHAAHPDTVVKLSWAWNMSDLGGGVVHGVQLMGPRKKKLGPFLAHSEEHSNTPAGALRSLADLLDVEES